ncbi:hypothetical protein J4Q44_G00096270 [Coregonus suidteri]|uniref:Interferon-induced protein 44-like protein n=1 Tax=Coregonus suidteri TaxID=861788 RepID=A0AAN8LXF4_9TELE
MSFGGFMQPVKVGLTEISAPVFGGGTSFSVLPLVSEIPVTTSAGDDKSKSRRRMTKNSEENGINSSGGFAGLPGAEQWQSKMETPWREVAWTEDRRETLMESISSYKPGCEAVSEARVLLLGPVGAGKSSFISSVQSVFTGRVTNRAMVGSSSASFTKKINKAGALLGMSTSYIVPVKNYSSELDVDENTDILLLSAVDHILQYVDLHFQDCAATMPNLSL